MTKELLQNHQIMPKDANCNVTAINSYYSTIFILCGGTNIFADNVWGIEKSQKRMATWRKCMHKNCLQFASFCVESMGMLHYNYTLQINIE